ncbi:hypothetical protein [Paenibacillus qinlingensis]|uniref:hypothetical protein n=1 Tax=Paenibacillus qinlingensis TaxID=1837343 RepID=UPI0015673E15|nr:hypothetical protein [Paenibacillus qinlingensis]NQX63270.1 hypothetical protein [Paenibacillus qinlingensis]
MLTLIKGKARKSEYMQVLHKGTNNSIMVLYGHDFPVLMPEGKDVITYVRSEKSKTDMLELESDLIQLMAQIIGHTSHKIVYLYGNFEPIEIDILLKISENQNVKPALSIVATIQDDSVPNGQIVIEEIR